MGFKFFVSLIVYFLLPLTIFAQQGLGFYKIFYEMTFQKDSTEALKSSELTELLTNGEKSIFRSQGQATRDTFQYHKDLVSRPYLYLSTAAEYRIVKDYEERTIHYYEVLRPFLTTMHHTIERQSILDWTIMPDTMMVSNLLCQKATVVFGNRYWEAWFAVDLPISDGPYKFCGLPGLVVAIADTTGSWAFKLVEIEKAPPFEFDLKFLENSTISDKASFYKMKRHYRDNLAQVSEAVGHIAFLTEESRQDAYRSNKIQAMKDNNWIELAP